MNISVRVKYNTADGTMRTIDLECDAPTRVEAVRDALGLVPDDAIAERIEVADKIIN